MKAARRRTSDPGRRRGGAFALRAAVVLAAAAGGLAGAGTLVYRARSGAGAGYDLSVTAPVAKGPLRITVNEPGTLQAESMERITSEVEGHVTILYIVPEGAEITPQDVEQGRVLVELDSSGLRERITRQEITTESAASSLTKAREDLRIQMQQNESNVRKAALEVKFAQMEVEHYLGSAVAARVAEDRDYAALARAPDLGGAAQKQRAALESDVHLAEEELERATDKLSWTQQLHEKKYVTRNELKADELALERSRADLEQAKLALRLFERYELPKEAELRVAAWQESLLERDRVVARADSAEAQGRAHLKSAEATYENERKQLEKLREQADRCTLRAPKPGLVVYASSLNRWRRQNRPIQEGATVDERQEIIFLPDLRSMIAEIAVHESQVKQVQPGQEAVVTVDAVPDLRLRGKVSTVASLPDPQNWMQDVKVYTAKVTIEGTHPGLKPGMSCRAEIAIASLDEATYVPLQAVVSEGEGKACYVSVGGRVERRAVETGLFDDRVVQITAGLRPGEQVLMNPPAPALEAAARPGPETESEAAPTPTREGSRPGAAASRETPASEGGSRGSPAAPAPTSPAAPREGARP